MPSNNKDVAKLNEYNLGCLEGMSYAKEGKLLEDILPKVGTAERQNGIKAGYAKYLSEAAADENGSMKEQDEFGAESDIVPTMGEDEFGAEPEDEFGDESDVDFGGELGDSVKAYNASPSFKSFAKVYDALSKGTHFTGAWLKSAAFAFVHSSKKIKDSVYIQVGGQQSVEYWLNRLLADEFIAWYQYFIVEKFLLGDERPHIQETFKTNGDDELNDHAAKLLQRMHDLGLQMSWLASPATWDEYASGKFFNPGIDVNGALVAMVQSENTAIAAYSEACNTAEQLGDRVSLDLFKAILADEQEHLANLQHFIKDKQF